MESLPTDVIRMIARSAGLKGAIVLSSTSHNMSNILSKDISKKKGNIEKTFNNLIVQYYLNLNKRMETDLSNHQIIRIFVSDNIQIFAITDIGIVLNETFCNTYAYENAQMDYTFEIDYIYNVLSQFGCFNFPSTCCASMYSEDDSDSDIELVDSSDVRHTFYNPDVLNMIEFCKAIDECMPVWNVPVRVEEA
jgi:hypothetical protein